MSKKPKKAPTPAAGPWKAEFPTACGLYIAESVESIFPEGDPNNVCHTLVNIVLFEGACAPLFGGRIVPAEECAGWLWAKVFPSSRT